MVNTNDIIAYSKKITATPLQQKLVQAFTDSLLNSEYVERFMELLKSKMRMSYENLENSFFLHSLSKKIYALHDSGSFEIVAYSLKKKNWMLFTLIGNHCLTCDIIKSVTTSFGNKVSTFTDMEDEENAVYEIKLTDGGDENVITYTDTDINGNGFVLWSCRYIKNEELIPNTTTSDYLYKYSHFRVQDDRQLTEGLQKAAALLTICKPARIPVIFYRTPTVFIWNDLYGNGGYRNWNSDSPLFTKDELEELLDSLFSGAPQTEWNAEHFNKNLNQFTRIVSSTSGMVSLVRDLSYNDYEEVWNNGVKTTYVRMRRLFVKEDFVDNGQDPWGEITIRGLSKDLVGYIKNVPQRENSNVRTFELLISIVIHEENDPMYTQMFNVTSFYVDENGDLRVTSDGEPTLSLTNSGQLMATYDAGAEDVEIVDGDLIHTK